VSWARRLCQELGAQSEGCSQAEAALPILPERACQAALDEVQSTVARSKQARGTCDRLVDRLCADVGQDRATCELVRQRTAEIPSGRCQELLDHYTDVLEEVRHMAKRHAPITAEMVAKQASGDVPSFGPKDARVTVIEYSDFQCPYCQEASKTVSDIRRRYGTVVRFVFRQFPLPMHRHARGAAEAALAAHQQGKFWEYHDLLFANQERLERADLESYATQAGLDLVKFRRALDDGATRPAVQADVKLGDDLGVEGTPTMIVGTERVPDARDFDDVARRIEAQLKAAGVPIPAAP
jgi:protein-disulfide isomerase